MRRSLILAALAVGLIALSGCAQTRCAIDKGKQQVSRVASCFKRCPPPEGQCAPQPETICYTDPVYANLCGGDNGIGRGGTGAFKIP